MYSVVRGLVYGVVRAGVWCCEGWLWCCEGWCLVL